jgi:tRNA-dihydrouridine synthase B
MTKTEKFDFLRGSQFTRIGMLVFDHPVFLAPMAGITNLPFRTIARRFGCRLAFTEMVSVNGLVRGSQKTCRYLDSDQNDRPLGVQIFGGDPDLMAEGARIVTDRGADLIDINMGCPVKKVVRSGAGAALLRDPEKAGMIIRAVRRATSLPLTVKIRSGWRPSEITAPIIARIVEDEGANALVIHPRTVDQGFSGTADWTVIRTVKEILHIPVVGSGDIRSPGDARKMMQITNCDAVMIGRAALGNPWIFRNIVEAEGEGGPPGKCPSVSLEEREQVIRDHLKMETEYSGEEGAVQSFRKHLLWYTKGLRGSAPFRQKISRFHEREPLLAALRAYFEEVNNADDFGSKCCEN